MTYNVDEGTDFIELQNATTSLQFLLAGGATITQVRATNPAARMKAVAAQIAAAAPALVSLQEVDTWSSGSFDPVSRTCGTTSVEFDMLTELLDALTAQGAHYQVAIKTQQFAFPPTPALIPPATFLCVQFNDDNVILARTDLPTDKFSWSNAQSGQFTHILTLTTPIGILPLPRVWNSVDAVEHGEAFRFINTHLESVDAAIRQQQGAELRAGPANTNLPVIIAMDSNAQAAPLPVDQTYSDFVSAGYQDAWTQIFPTDPGLTCCQAQLVNNAVSQLYQRIDLILTLGPVLAQDIALYGADPASMTPGGLWPSDHAGVAAQLTIQQL
jgi:endonuclease/exonuclease/phosphatase family metal-dependent hydrolase